MVAFESLASAIEELGRKVENMERTLNQKNAKVLESHVLPAEQTRSEDIPMGFSRTEEYSDKTVVVFEEGEFSFEDVLDRKEEEVLFASCRLVQIYNLRAYDDDQESRMGLLDIKRFEAAYERERRRDKIRARELRNYWQTKISALEGMEEIPFKPYDEGELERFRVSYGVDLYRIIRKAFREMRVASRTGVSNKPWNAREGRDATLSEIMITVQISNRRHPIRREA